MMTNRISRRSLLGGVVGAVALGAGAVAVVACRREGSDPPDRGQILADLSTIVIMPAYADAATDTKALETSLVTLQSSPTAESLAGARAAWKKARAAWKVTDAFLFGPADDLALTGGAIDAPPDIAKLEALASPTATTVVIDAASVAALGASQRGFGGVEVLLFDPSKDDAAMLAMFQTADGRRRNLAALIGSNLREKVDAVKNAWNAAPTRYGEQLATSGRGSTIYTSERQGLDAIVNAMLNASEVLISLKLAKPLGIDKTPVVPAPNLVESQRSDASIEDILSVLDGIERVYVSRSTGVLAAGLPLADAVIERSPSADQHMRAHLTKARDAVKAIPAPLRTAVVEHRDPVIAAHDAVREVKRTISAEIAGALGTSVGFGVTDGD